MITFVGWLLVALPVAPILGVGIVTMARQIGWRLTAAIWAFSILGTASLTAGVYLIEKGAA